jgi:DNA-binding ferritin-like protein
MNKQLTELIQRLLLGRAQFHAWHLSTGYYARHKAFKTIYESLSGHADTIAEAVQDNDRLLFTSTTFEFDDNDDNAEQMLRSLLEACSAFTAEDEDQDDESFECPAYIQNMIQDLEKDLHKGLYLLSLK